MSKTPLTNEQKEWFLYGYFHSLANQLATDLKISVEEVREILINGLESRKR